MLLAGYLQLAVWCVESLMCIWIFGVLLEMALASLIDIKSGKVVEQIKANLVSVNAPSIVKISLSPQDMKSYYKSGNNLVIELASGEQIVLEGFFVVAPDGARNELVLEDQGHYWHASYGENEASLSLEEISGIDKLLISEGGGNAYMWLVGALGLGGVVALADSGGGGGGGSDDSQPGASSEGQAEVQSPTTASNQPVAATQTVAGEESDPSTVLTRPLMEPQVGAVDPTTGELPVTGKPGASVQLQDKDGKPVGTPVVLDAQGQGTVTVPPEASGEPIKVVVTGDGQPSSVTTVDVPALATQEGTVDPTTGELPVTGKPGATAQLQDKDGNPIGNPVVLDGEGKGTLVVPPSESGEQLDVLVDGQLQSTVEVPVLTTQPPVVVPSPVVVDKVDPSTGELLVTGKPGGTAQLQDKDGNPIGNPVVLDGEGKGTLVVPPSESGEQLDVLVDGQLQSTVEVPVLTTQPPVVVPSPVVVDKVDPSTGELLVTGKPGGTAQLQDKDGNPIGNPVVLDSEGKGTLVVPPSESGKPLDVLVDGQLQSTVEVPVLTTQPPVVVPSPVVVDKVNPNTGELLVTGKPGGTAQLQDKDRNPIGTPVVLDGEGKGTLVVPPSESGKQLDVLVDGQLQSTVEVPVLTTQPPVVAPSPVVVDKVDPNTGELLVTGKPGGTAQLQDKDGNPIGNPVVLDSEGKGTLVVPPSESGKQLDVLVDGELQSTVEVPVLTVQPPVVAPSPTVVDKVDPNTGELLVTGKPGGTAQLQDKDGNPIGNPVVLDSEGKGTLTVPPSESGKQLDVLVDGQLQSTVEVPVLTVQPPVVVPSPVVVDKVNPNTGELLVTGKPGGTAQLQDKDGNPIGNPVVLDSEGKGTLVVPPSESGKQINVLVTDGDQQSPVATVDVPLLAPQLGPIDPATGALPVTGTPMGTAQLQDQKGNLIGTPVSLDAKGQGTLIVPPSLSGEPLELVVTGPDGKQSPVATVEVPVLTPQVDVPVLAPQFGPIDPATGALPVTGTPMGTAQLQDKDGKPIGTPVSLDAKGQGTLIVPPSLSGEPLELVVTGPDGKQSPVATVEVPVLAPQFGPIDPATGALPVTGTPMGTAQLQDKDGKPIGTPVSLDAKGQGTLVVPPSLSGEPLELVVTGPDGKQSPVATLDVPLLAPQLGTVDPITGELLVTGKPDANAQLQDKNGQPIGSPILLDAQGQGVITLTHGAGGESLRVIVEEGGQQSSATQVDTPLLKPVLGPVDALTGQLTLEGKPDATVKIDVPGGTAISVVLDQQGKGSVILPSIASHESLEGTLTSGDLVSAPVSIAVPVLAPRNGEVNDTGTHLTVNGKPGEIIKVMGAQGVELGSGVVGKDGAIEIVLNSQQSSEAGLTLTAYNKGEASPAITVAAPVIDTERPLPPTDLNINPDGTRVLGKAKVGETMKIVNLDTQEELGTFTVGPDGFFSANIPSQAEGDRLSITVEKGGKTSLPALLLVPLDGPQAPAKPFEVSIDVTGTKVQGKGAPNTIAQVKSADNLTVLGKGLVGPDGTFQVSIAPQPGGQLLSVALQNNDRVSDSETVMSPYIDSNTPADVSIDESGTQVTGKGTAGETIRIKREALNDEIGAGVVKPDGTFVVTIAQQPADQALIVTAQGQGIESAPAYVQTPAFDAGRPPQPNARIDASATKISGKAEAGANVSVKDAAGNLLTGPVRAGEDGTFAAEIARLPAGTPIKVVAEVAGKESLSSELIVPLLDGEAVPPTPLSASISADGKSVFGKATPNSHVVVADAKGAQLGIHKVGDDGSYVVPIAVQKGGATLNVFSATDDGVSPSVSVLAPLQLTAQTQDVQVGLFIDPYLNELTDTKTNTFATPGSTFIGAGIDWFRGIFGAEKDLFSPESTYEFSVAENEKVEVIVSNKALLSGDVLRGTAVAVDKRIGNGWVNLAHRGEDGLFNLSAISVLSDISESDLSIRAETPGEYRVTIYDISALGLGVKEYTTTITRESFAGGFANNAITNDLILPPGAKLLKVNGKELGSETYTAIQGKQGELRIGTDGQASYVQDKSATAGQSETFTYEAREESGTTRRGSFTIKTEAPAVSGDLLAQDDAHISSVGGTLLSSTAERTIHGKFGDLKIKADGQYTYTPKLSLAGLNETDSFEYVVRHVNGEEVTSTLNVHIAEAGLVAELKKVPVSLDSVTDLSINPDGTRVLGKAKAGETVKIVNLDTQEDLGTFAVARDGFFSANIPLQAGGARLSITAKKGEETSLSELLLVPLGQEQTPAKPFEVSIDVTGTEVQGKGAPNSIALVKSADNQAVLGKGLVGPDGTFQVSIAPHPGGQLLNVVLQNNGKVSDSQTVMTPDIDSNTPTAVSIDESGTQVIGKGKAGDTIRVKDAQGIEIGAGVVRLDGTFVVTIAQQPAGQTLIVTAQGRGVESASTYVQTPVFDVGRPPLPDVEITSNGTHISGKTEPSARVSVKDAAGNLLAGPVLAGDDGKFAADIAKLPAGTPIKVVAEVAGKASLPSELIVPFLNEAAPPAPLSVSVSADGKSVFGKAAPNSTVVVKDAQGNVLGERMVSNDGSYVVPIAVQRGGATLDVFSATPGDDEALSPSVSVLAPFQLTAEAQDVQVGLFIDPAISEVTVPKTAIILTPGSFVIGAGIDWLREKLGAEDNWFPTGATYNFSVAENERVEVNVSNSASLSGDFLRGAEMAVDKRIGNEWVNVARGGNDGVFNLSASLSSDIDESGISIRTETPGEYRVTIYDVSALGLGAKEYTTTITSESFAGGFASSAITNGLVLPPGAKLLKVNGKELANEGRTAIQGKQGELRIGTDGRASYVQDKNVVPSDHSETFAYEARTATEETLRGNFTVTSKAPSVSGDLLSQDDAHISSVGGTPLPVDGEQTIHGKFGDLKIKADGQYTYTPKLSLAGLNETDSFEYVARHESGETITSTLNVHIADARLVAELEKVPTGLNPVADLTETDAASQNLPEVNNDDSADLLKFNLQAPKLDTSKLIGLQAEDDPSEAPLTLTLEDILQPDGTISSPVSTSVLDLPDSWKPDVSVSQNGRDYLRYIDPTTNKDLWVENGISVI
ncbi:Ig-like domain-containing protein [Pseudomonas chlororaphis subsp. piscium]